MPPGRARVIWISLISVAAVAVGVFGWWTLTNPANGLRADGTSFEVIDDHTVTVSFQLTAPLHTPVACAVEALDPEYGVVGWKVVEFPASGAPVRAFTETVPTLALATTGLVNNCWVT